MFVVRLEPEGHALTHADDEYNSYTGRVDMPI